MCYNCGCHKPDDDMGHPDNITNKTLMQLGSEWNKSFEEVKKMFYESIKNNTYTPEEERVFEKAAKAWGQSIQDAKKKTFELLKKEFETS